MFSINLFLLYLFEVFFLSDSKTAVVFFMIPRIMKLQESGIIDGWRMKWWSSQGNKCKANSQVNAVDQLDLLYLAGPFFIFLGAMTLSIILVVIEKICIADKCRSLRGALQSRAVMNVRYRSQ